MKLLITGTNGQLGQAFMHHIKKFKPEHKIIALSKKALDITDEHSVHTNIQRHQPDWVLNFAAFTQTDNCELDKDKAFDVNAKSVGYLAKASKDIKANLLTLSSDYVFNGEKGAPYKEEDPLSPLNVYGQSKQAAEAYLEEYTHIINLRVSWVFSVFGQNFVTRLLKLLTSRDEIAVVNDQVGCPTPADAIVGCILKMLEKPFFTTFHFCGKRATSWYDYACTIRSNYAPLTSTSLGVIKPVSSNQWHARAKRPAYSVLNCDKIFKHYGIIQPDWATALRTTLAQLSQHAA